MKTAFKSLWYEPLMISMYECEQGGGVGRHDHGKAEPCHITIVAAGSVAITTYDAGLNEKKHYVVKAPACFDYNDGSESHHKIEALEDGTVFYNLPRVARVERKHVAQDIFGGEA